MRSVAVHWRVVRRLSVQIIRPCVATLPYAAACPASSARQCVRLVDERVAVPFGVRLDHLLLLVLGLPGGPGFGLQTYQLGMGREVLQAVALEICQSRSNLCWAMNASRSSRICFTIA